MVSACTLQIFAKAPVPGNVKTRLTPVLSARQAAALQAALIEHTVRICVEAAVGVVELWCAPDCGHDVFAACSERFGVELRQQRGQDLGQRMHFALTSSVDKGHRGILIGSDCPALNRRYLRQACSALDGHDAVLGPAEDGGYVLIGLSKKIACFEEVRWGSVYALADTARHLCDQGANWCALPVLWDVDTPADLIRLASFPELAKFADGTTSAE